MCSHVVTHIPLLKHHQSQSNLLSAGGAPASFTFHKIITTRATAERVLSHLNYGSQDFYSSISLARVFPLPLPFLSLSLSVTEAMSNA